MMQPITEPTKISFIDFITGAVESMTMSANVKDENSFILASQDS